MTSEEAAATEEAAAAAAAAAPSLPTIAEWAATRRRRAAVYRQALSAVLTAADRNDVSTAIRAALASHEPAGALFNASAFRECLRKLEECRRESGGLFFLSVWADKYGFCPLPRGAPNRAAREPPRPSCRRRHSPTRSAAASFSDAELDAARMDGLRGEMDEEQERRFDACYVRDENAVPPEYVLRSGVTSKHWDDFSTLRRDLQLLANEAGWDAAEVRAKFVRSITETESEVALEGLQPGGDLARIVWLRRQGVARREFRESSIQDFKT